MTRPAFASVREWCRISGMGQKATYAAINAELLPARCPQGGRLLIDVDLGLAWLRSLPQASSQMGAKRGKTAHNTAETKG